MVICLFLSVPWENSLTAQELQDPSKEKLDKQHRLIYVKERSFLLVRHHFHQVLQSYQHIIWEDVPTSSLLPSLSTGCPMPLPLHFPRLISCVHHCPLRAM